MQYYCSLSQSFLVIFSIIQHALLLSKAFAEASAAFFECAAYTQDRCVYRIGLIMQTTCQSKSHPVDATIVVANVALPKRHDQAKAQGVRLTCTTV